MTNRYFFVSFSLLVFLKLAAVSLTEFSLYGDEAQYWLWSQAPDLGYYSKPPLLAWFLGGYTGLFGSSFVSLKTFPIVVYFFIYFAIYVLCLSLSFDKNSSLLCAISFLVVPAASLSSFIISTDLLLLLFWTMAMILVLRIIKKNTTFNFFLLGLFLGLAFLAKYAAIYFVISFLLLLIIDKKTFDSLKNNPFGFFVFLFSFFLVFIPNVWWNISNDWVTLSHTADNANLKNLNLNLYEPFQFLGSQIIMVGPFLFFFFILFFKYFRLDFENKFLLIFSLPILLVVLIEGFLVRANANWAAPALISFFVMFFRLVNNRGLIFIKVNFVFNYFVAVCLFVSILVSLDNKIFSRINGIDAFAEEVFEKIYNKDLVVSDRIIFSNISYLVRNKQNKVFMPHKKNSLVTNHFQMSAPLPANRKDGFFLIGSLSDVSYLSKEYKGTLIKEFSVPFNSTKITLYEIDIK